MTITDRRARWLALIVLRLGDLYGHRRLFVAGVAVFTAASVACGLAQSQQLLVGVRVRVVQGIGDAVVSAVALPRRCSPIRRSERRRWAPGSSSE